MAEPDGPDPLQTDGVDPRWVGWADDEALWARARAWAESTPDWSDEQWRRINRHLRYRMVEKKGARESSAD